MGRPAGSALFLVAYRVPGAAGYVRVIRVAYGRVFPLSLNNLCFRRGPPFAFSSSAVGLGGVMMIKWPTANSV
jgi:hypothetical protein